MAKGEGGERVRVAKGGVAKGGVAKGGVAKGGVAKMAAPKRKTSSNGNSLDGIFSCAMIIDFFF